MFCRSRCALQLNSFRTFQLLGWLACLGMAAGIAAAGSEAPANKTLVIALSKSITHDVPEIVIRASARPMLGLIEAQTRLKPEFTVAPSADALAEQLASGQVKLGVFQGCEFAWARQLNPKLRPLVIAINQQPLLYAAVIVRNDSTATGIADLANQMVAIPGANREHCRLFYDRLCRTCGKDASQFGSRVTKPATVEEALDQVVEGEVQVALVDCVALDCYQRRKPGRFSQLKELARSEAFPPTVVAYQAGALDEATQKCFRDGLIGAKQTTLGRQALLMWRISAFEPVPNNYEKLVADVARTYPRPAKPKLDNAQTGSRPVNGRNRPRRRDDS